MKRNALRALVAVLLAALLLPLLPTVTFAAEKAPTKISTTDVTSIVLAEAYDSIASAQGNTIYLEKNLGPAYFDSVRRGDTLTLRVRVEKAGTYQWCMMTGWASPHVNGAFTLIMDGNEAATIVNEVPGAGWRTWLDTTPGTVELPAGEHEMVIRFDSDGPNVYGLKFAPEGVNMKVEGGYATLNAENDDFPIQITTDYAIQLNPTVPFDSITVGCPSYNNNKGSLRFELFKWNENYVKTVEGTPVATQEFIDFNDNANLTMKFDEYMPMGEYVLRLTNISTDTAEQVGVWTSREAPENIRNFQAGVEIPNAARGTIHYIGATSSPLGSLSADLRELPSYEEITESQKDLSQYHLPASSRYPAATVMPDTWVFTDGLGRVSLTNQDVGDPRNDKTVAMFFWNWHATFANSRAPFNVQNYIDAQTAAGVPLEDYLYDYNHAGWGSKNPSEIQYFWDEPIYGYYRSDDAWVLRRQAELLTAAGVDVIFTDNTNATLTWADAYPVIYQTWLDAMADGVDTPKVSNYLPFGAGTDTAIQLREYFTTIYHDGNYRPLWFYWDGKPMMVAHGAASLGDSTLDRQIKDFFTFRAGQPDYFVKNTAYGTWGWLSTAPQARYFKNLEERREAIVEQMTVGVAMNADYEHMALAAMSGHNIMGRSYTKAYQDRYVKEGAEASKWGYNFAEQWENAIKIDPRVVFVTGWNEWCASRYTSWPDNPATAVENAFPDQFDNEHSRDIEPSRGDLSDHYYYQLVNYVRQYKGARPIPTPSAAATMDMTAGIDQWAQVEPYYAANIGNTDDRDADGYRGTHYSDFSGRNDIIGAQIARNGEDIWFLVECAEAITPYTDKLWMNLYIDVNAENAGWNSFDFVVNKTAPTETAAVLERFIDGYTSEKVADVAYKVDGRYLTVKIPKAALGIEGETYTINFAWTDNVHDVADAGEKNGDTTVYSTFSGDILDFYTSGDVAPGGRFKFSYISTPENSGLGGTTDTETETDPESVTEPGTDAPTMNHPGTNVPTSPAETDAPAGRGGCQSAVAASAAILAVAAAVVLGKKHDM